MLVVDQRLLRVETVHPDDAPAQKGYRPEATGTLDSRQGRLEGLDSLGLYVQEEEGGRIFRERLGYAATEVPFHERDCDQHGEAEAQRKHDVGRRVPRPLEIRDRNAHARGEPPAETCPDSGPARPVDGARGPYCCPPGGAKSEQNEGRTAGKPGGKLPIGGAQYGEERERGPPGKSGCEMPGTAGASADPDTAKEGNCRSLLGPRQRPEREGEGGEQPKECAQAERFRIDAESDRGRQQRGNHSGDNQRRKGACRESGEHAHRRQGCQLGEIDREHDTAGCPQALESGDHIEFRIEPRSHRVADTHSAHEQGGEADQVQKRAEAIHHPLDAGSRVLVGADLPSSATKTGAELRSHHARLLSLRELERVLVIHEAAFAEKFRFGERVQADHDPWPETEGSTRAGAVGLSPEGASHLEHHAPD